MKKILLQILGNEVGAVGVVTNESSVAIVEETTEATYKAPSNGDGTEYIEVLSEGTEMNLTRELLERDTLSSTVETEAARVGLKSVDASIPVEYRASNTEGAAPQALDALLKSALGGKRTAATQDTSTGSTATVLEFGVAPNFSAGDVVLVKESGAYELRPVASVGATSITLAFALTNGAPTDGVTVAAVTTYYHNTATSSSLSIEHNVGNEIQQQGAGLRVETATIENWSVGQIPQMSFTLGGLSLDRVDAAATESPDFTNDALPPVALEACLYINGIELDYTELGMSIENTLNFLTSACNANGKISSRITGQTINFTANPYLDDTSTPYWDAFNTNDDVSIFFFAYNPTATAGQFANAVSVWLPQAKITEIPIGDQDGIATENLAARAHRQNGNDSIFLSFI